MQDESFDLEKGPPVLFVLSEEDGIPIRENLLLFRLLQQLSAPLDLELQKFGQEIQKLFGPNPIGPELIPTVK